MRTRIWVALAKGVVLESIRRKDMWVLAILGGVIVLAAAALGLVGIAGLEIFVKDLAVTVLGAFSTILAVLTSSRVFPEEVANRTLYPLLARPVRRIDLLIGKFLGAVVVSWAGFLVLAVLVSLVLAVFHIPLGLIALQYCVVKCLGIAVVCSVGLLLSMVMTPAAAATTTFILAFGSPMLSRAFVLTAESTPGARPLCRVLEALLPQVHLFDLGARVVYIDWSPISIGVLVGLAAYAGLYSSSAIFGSWLVLRKRAF
jgi:ABC-type transport system involved in multi-copper enzyme maturation permease subunit